MEKSVRQLFSDTLPIERTEYSLLRYKLQVLPYLHLDIAINSIKNR